VEELLLSVVQDDPRVRPLAERLQHEGGGNPYVITEMIETLVQDGFVIPGPGDELGHLAPGAFESALQALPVPRTIRELWRARVEPVSAAGLQVLRTLAASPEPLDRELISAGSALEEQVVERGLDELLERRLARIHPGSDDQHYELGLARLRDVLIEDADDAVMAAIHARLGARLERRHRKSPAQALEVMAFHFERARVPAKAYQYLLSSAERQLSRGYRREALELLDRALAMEEAARVSLLLDDADRLLAEGLLNRAKALHHLGRWEEAEATAAKAEATAIDFGRDWLVSKVLATRAEILRFTRGSDVARDLARQALEKAKQASDPKLEVEPLFDLGGLAWERGELDHARQYWLEGLAKAQGLSLEALAARGYGGLGVVAICRGQLAEARRYLEQAYETCDRLGLVEQLTVSGCNLVELHHFSGHLRKGLELAERVVARTREVQYPFGTALALRYRALMLVDLGQLQEAEESAREALRIVEGLGEDHTRFETLVVLVRVAMANEAHEEAARLLDLALPLGAASDTEGFVPLLHAWKARLEARRGETDAARGDLARAEERVEGVWPHQRVRLLLNIARVHEVLDEHERARDRAEAALRLADSNGFRYYAMRARQILARVSRDEAVVARNARVADALARSLAANLPEDDARRFLELQSRIPS
jgi:tetratricopeptide (TPR) repeat protein